MRQGAIWWKSSEGFEGKCFLKHLLRRWKFPSVYTSSDPKTASFRVATVRNSTNSVSQNVFCSRNKLGGLKLKEVTNATKPYSRICATFLYDAEIWTFRKIGQGTVKVLDVILEKDGNNSLDRSRGKWRSIVWGKVIKEFWRSDDRASW